MVPYTHDEEYMRHVGHLIDTPKVQKLGNITHHYHSTRLEHSINVSYTSYKLAKKFGWDARSTARGGLLHDLFFYDWRDTKFKKGHAWTHPRIAVRNAQKVTSLNHIEKDIIVKHMFGATIAPPRYKESWIVTCVDKYWAVREATLPLQHKWKNRKILRLKLP
ncbi:HD domain-containing protein [Streptococcus ovis]|uniref:HD domain-containing protein n=1 Tax=Streptococcus ovis TaxID=82806 RepID=UPI0003653B25|nr:HD domain-containing protein [Streptococcus ovis]